MQTLSNWSYLTLLLTGAVCASMGIVTIIVWHAGILSLIQTSPDSVPIVYNEALLFVLCGAGLILLAINRPRAAAVCGGATVLLAVTTMAEILFNWQLGLDQLFVRDIQIDRAPYPGRMIFPTSLAFLLAGASLLVSGLTSISYAVVMAGLWGGTILVLDVVCAVYLLAGLPLSGLAHWSTMPWQTMSWQTLLGLCVLGIGILTLAWHKPLTTIRWINRRKTLAVGVAVSIAAVGGGLGPRFRRGSPRRALV